MDERNEAPQEVLVDEAHDAAPATRSALRRGLLRTTLLGVLVAWVFLYNLLVKRQGLGEAFFEIIDTISDDLVVGTLTSVGIGLGIVAVFSVTKLYTQIIANVHSFRILELLVLEEFAQKRYRRFFSRLLRMEDQPLPATKCPERVGTVLFSIAFIYVMSWVYLVLFSEALYFMSWSAGVDLMGKEFGSRLMSSPERMMMLPTLALALPFSARVMAYLRYPYAQDYADFLPAAVFVLLIVTGLGKLFNSDDQRFFLLEVYRHPENWGPFLRNGALLAFMPVFFEVLYWLLELGREDLAEEEGGPDS